MPARPPLAPREPELLAALVSQVQDYAIFVLDPTGHVVTWNAGAQRFKGYTAEQIVGEHFSAEAALAFTPPGAEPRARSA